MISPSAALARIRNAPAAAAVAAVASAAGVSAVAALVATGALVATAGPAAAQCDERTLEPPDPAANARFGRDLDLSGDALVVGAIFDTEAGDRAGAGYAYRRDPSGSWILETKLLAADAAADAQLGGAVAVHGTATILGAGTDDGAGTDAGAAYVFRRDEASGTWSEEAKLVDPEARAIDRLGIGVAIADGRAVVGQPGRDDRGGNAGSAVVFTDDGTGTWSLAARLYADDAATDDAFGSDVAIDGDFIAVSAPSQDAAAADAGAVYVFRDEGGGTWVQEAKLVAPDARPSQALGLSIDLDAGILVAGASLDREFGADAGAAYVFARGGGGTWHFAKKLVASDAGPRSFFGQTVTVDAGDIAVGAHRARVAGVRTGVAYLFLGDGLGGFDEAARLAPVLREDNDNVGFSVALGGTTLAVGSRLRVVDGNASAGSVTTFEARDAACLCLPGSVDAASDPTEPAELLFVNGDDGGSDRTVSVPAGERIVGYVLLPPAGGNGKFVVHANAGDPSLETVAVLPASIGTACFPLLLPDGAMPLAIWNAIGRRNQIGESRYFDGTPIPDPVPAPSIFLQLDEGDPTWLPVGTRITLQGAIVDPGSASERGGSVTNGIVLVVE